MAKKRASPKSRPGTKRGRQKNTPAKNTPAEKPLSEVPAPPDYLGDYAQEYWRTVAPVLIDSKILTSGHLGAFAALCEAWQEYRLNQDWIVNNPESLTFQTEKGYIAEDPRIRFRNNALDNLMKLWAKFGMTPKALADLKKNNNPGGGVPAIVAFAAGKYDDTED
ncbi:phage terminase small subunit P27 family [Rosistilla oblonga]|uniref:phage terminase small subunit P27 family n=1 Tax=Rosistilla oblonga TaxID=2527990 RepID=UPI003A97E90D